MATFSLKIALFLSFFATLIGCSPTYYKVNLINAPNFREKGQTHLAAHIGGYGAEVQAAYAITDHLAIQGNYEKGEYVRTTTTSTSLFSSSTTTKTTSTEGALGEFAIGYFKPLNESIAMGLYGGYGSGRVDNNWDFEGASSAKLRKYFLQGTVGTNDENFQVIGSAKLARLNYYDLRQTYTNQGYIDAFNVLKSPLTVVELGAVIRVGFKHVKFQLQGNFISSSTITNPQFQPEALSIGLGICVQLGGNKNEMKDENEKKNEKKKKYEKKDKTYKYELF